MQLYATLYTTKSHKIPLLLTRGYSLLEVEGFKVPLISLNYLDCALRKCLLDRFVPVSIGTYADNSVQIH